MCQRHLGSSTCFPADREGNHFAAYIGELFPLEMFVMTKCPILCCHVCKVPRFEQRADEGLCLWVPMGLLGNGFQRALW